MRLLSFNVYFGFDGLSALNDPELGLRQFQATDAHARMQGLARFLAKHSPDVVGLQEMVRFSFTDGAAPEVFIDFLDILLEALASAGAPRYQHFRQRGIASGGSVEMGEQTRGFLFEEFNVLLVRPEFRTQETNQLEFQNFATRAGIELRQGLQRVRASSGETDLQLINTHLEAFSEPVRSAQAVELLDYLNRIGDPSAAFIVFGDLNAVPGSDVHQALTGLGLLDTFAAAGSGGGATCCQTPELDGDSNVATQRIDYVLVRGAAGAPPPRIGSSAVVLDERVPRSAGSGFVWPSDHFGVLSTVEFPAR